MRTAIPACLATLALVLAAAPAGAVVISNGALSVSVRNENGAIASLQYGGEWYATGLRYSDWGLQIGTSTTTFRANTATGFEGVGVSSVTEAGGVVTARGNYGEFGADVDILRSYELVTGLDALLISSTLTNNGSNGINLRYFDTYDPDGGGALATTNDVFALDGITVAQAIRANGSTGIIGSLSPAGGVLTFGSTSDRATYGFGIDDGFQLGRALLEPIDPDGNVRDSGYSIVHAFRLEAGQSLSLTYLHAYGTTTAAAQATFRAATAPPVPTPEPATMLLLGAGVLGLGVAARRRR